MENKASNTFLGRVIDGIVSLGKRFWRATVRIFKYHKLAALNVIILFTLGILLLYPLLYAFLASIATREELFWATILPKPASGWQEFKTNYAFLFTVTEGGMVKAFFVTVSRMAWGFFIGTVTAVLGGFAFAKLRFPGRKYIFMFMLGTMMIPGVALMIPNYIWLTKFPLVGGNNLFGQGGRGFVNNPLFLYATGWVGVYNIFLFRQAFVGVGNQLMESGKIDGANLMSIAIRIYMPLVSPLIVVILLNAVTGVWADYMTDLLYLPDRPDWWSLAKYTVWWSDYFTNPNLTGGADYPKAFAILILMMVPPIILFAAVQRKFVAGLTAGAVKG